MNVLMVGVDKQTKGGMWTVVENYLNNKEFCDRTNLKYIPTSIIGSKRARVLFTFKAYLKIIGSLINGNYDITHIHMSERGSVYRKNIVIILAKIFRTKVVLHMHGAEFEKWYLESSERKKCFIKKVINQAERILILGEYWRPFVSSLLVDSSKLRVLHNAVAVESENQYNQYAKNILFLGAVVKRKGIYDLLDVFMEIKSKLDEEYKVIIYGPDFDKKIVEEIKVRNLENRVLYKGWLDRSIQKKVFHNIALNVLPSYNEGLPMTILETMAFGIPNISTDIAAIPEVINNQNGYLIKPGDKEKLKIAILSIIKNDSLRISKSNEAHKTIKEKFSIEYHLKELMKIYEELIK